MRQPIKQNIKKLLYKKNKTTNDSLDGSKLETFFKKNVLEKLKIKYIQQFEAKSIGRFYDFYLPDHQILIECDGFFFS